MKMPRNKLSDLNDHLFAQLERLSDEDISGEKLVEEMDRAKAITSIAKEIVSNGNLVLKAHIAASEKFDKGQAPKMLDVQKIEEEE